MLRRRWGFLAAGNGIMRIVLAIAGAVIGLQAWGLSQFVFAPLVGAAAGVLLAELIRLRRQHAALAKEVTALRELVAGRVQDRQATAPLRAADRTEPEPAAQFKDSDLAAQPPATSSGAEIAGTAPVAPAAGAWRAQPASSPNSAHMTGSAGTQSIFEPVASSAAAENATAAEDAREDWESEKHWRAWTGGAPPRSPEPAFVRAIREYFTGGNALVRVGIIILFFGVAFLLRYVAERTHVPIELRLTGVAIGAIVLMVLGWRLRAKRLGYALALQGGAIGILYLTVFAALRLYSVLPAAAAFLLMILIVTFSGALAVLQSSIELAVLGIIGGFLAPLLASTGEGNHVVLFSYYALLNAGIVGIAWFKAWRPLNVVGFLFTFVIATAWGVLRYRDDLFASTEPFLVLFFLFYIAIAVLFAARQPPQLKGYVDGTIVFGTPIVAFALQSALLSHRPYVLAFSALAVSALYLTLAWLLHIRRQATYRLLVEAFMALGVAFLTLAIPLALDGRWSAATWALEGAALVWIGCRQSRILPRVSGALLQIAAGIIFWRDVQGPPHGLPVLNSACLGGLTIAIAAVFATHMLRRHRSLLMRAELIMPPVLFFWGLLWWLIAGFSELARLPQPYEMSGALLFTTATALISHYLHGRFDLPYARWPALALLPAMALFALAWTFANDHVFAEGGIVAWPAAFAAFYFICRRHDPAPGSTAARLLHAGSAGLLIALMSWESAWAIDRLVQGGGSWPAIGWALLPALSLLALLRFASIERWPMAPHRETYVGIAGGGIALYLALWILITNLTLRGDPYPLPYVPLLNPLDLAEAFALIVLVRYGLYLKRSTYRIVPRDVERPFIVALALITFVWLNGVLVRALHHWAGIPFDLDAMSASTLAQTSVSIFWTVIALTAMLFATRRSQRLVWIGGAVLLTAVVAKLFLVDLPRSASVERIVSFVGVGILILVIGYFSPLPPATKATAAKEPA
jgi:uncharacterized membrane protein